MYHRNNCRFGFYVRKDSWHPSRYAKVVSIEFVIEGQKIKGDPPYYGGFKNPPGHRRAGKIMGPRLVRLEATWFEDGWMDYNGGMYAWTQVFPMR